MGGATRRDVLAALGLLGALALGGCSGESDTHPGPHPPDPCAADAGEAPAPLPYAVKTPELGSLFVLDLSGEPISRQLLARTLQGVVNRASARLYLIDDIADPFTPEMSRGAAQHWLSVFEEELGIGAAAQGTLDDALSVYASELEGYFLASEDEPWTFEAAGTEAAHRSAVAATAAEAAALEALGLPQLDSFVGRWPDAVSCYLDLAQRVGELPQPTFAAIHGNKQRPRDFLVQQGIVQVAGYPGKPEWPAVQAALARVSKGQPIYGYMALDGIQEAESVTEISQAGDVLVPSDSTANLSFFLAVKPKKVNLPPPVDTEIDCDAAELNVVIGLSDGDNLVVATTLYPSDRYWFSADRGRIPIAWSISPATRALAPVVLDYYARTVAPGDQLVEMIGPGYAYGSQMPNAGWFYDLAFQDMRDLGLRVLWLFDPFESGSGFYRWKERAEAALGCQRIDGLLDGYYPTPFHGAAPQEMVGTVPVLRAIGSYDDHPEQIAERIHEQLATPRDARPRVVFYSAAAWNNDVPGLVAALTPLEAEGVRFVSASAGLRCVTR